MAATAKDNVGRALSGRNPADSACPIRGFIKPRRLWLRGQGVPAIGRWLALFCLWPPGPPDASPKHAPLAFRAADRPCGGLFHSRSLPPVGTLVLFSTSLSGSVCCRPASWFYRCRSLLLP